MRQFRVVTTIEGLDRPTETITVKGPRGNYLTARVADPANLTKMRIGENIVVTLTEALAVSLEKVEKEISRGLVRNPRQPMKLNQTISIGRRGTGVRAHDRSVAVVGDHPVNAGPQPLPPLTTCPAARGCPANSSGPTSSPTTFSRPRNSTPRCSAGSLTTTAATSSGGTMTGPCAECFSGRGRRTGSAKPRWFGYISVANVERAQAAR